MVYRVWQHKRGLDDESVAVLLENLPSDYGDTDTEDDTDDEAPGSRDLINNDPRVQEECCTIIIGGDETAPDADVGNPDMDGRPITSEDDQTSQVNNKNKERRRWRKKSQSIEEGVSTRANWCKLSYKPN
ncbi:uncharacterized protein [Penaeus vannamei]|uniref:uncharacterized protein isoform X2 n=1 Tax=Penaeus vannamei TaxID=6689 RepID=UPI000F690AD8|nr:uncharacterized protein LOC113807317 isoform X2 [Penaeus vannamei]